MMESTRVEKLLNKLYLTKKKKQKEKTFMETYI